MKEKRILLEQIFKLTKIYNKDRYINLRESRLKDNTYFEYILRSDESDIKFNVYIFKNNEFSFFNRFGCKITVLDKHGYTIDEIKIDKLDSYKTRLLVKSIFLLLCKGNENYEALRISKRFEEYISESKKMLSKSEVRKEVLDELLRK